MPLRTATRLLMDWYTPSQNPFVSFPAALSAPSQPPQRTEHGAIDHQSGFQPSMALSGRHTSLAEPLLRSPFVGAIPFSVVLIPFIPPLRNFIPLYASLVLRCFSSYTYMVYPPLSGTAPVFLASPVICTTGKKHLLCVQRYMPNPSGRYVSTHLLVSVPLCM